MVVAVTNEYRVFVGETVTGRVLADIPVTNPSWAQRLNAPGPIDVAIPMRADEVRDLDIRRITEPWRCFLGISYDGFILEAGPIITRDYDWTDGLLNIGANGIWSLFDRRKAVRGTSIPDGAAVVNKPLTFRNMTLGTIARELVRISMQDNPYQGAQLPVVLPPFVAGTSTRIYQGYELGWVGERLEELTNVEDGPDIRFRPRFKDDDPALVEWVMETGAPLLTQSGEDWVWDTNPDQSGVIGLSVSEDASSLAMKAWVPGAGADVSMKLATQTNLTLVNAGYPWLEVDEAAKDVESSSVLQKHANRLLTDSLRPTETWTLNVAADLSPKLGTYRPGDWAVIHVPENHPVVQPGPRRARIMAIDGDTAGPVKLALQPMRQPLTGSSEGDGETVTKPSDVLLYPGLTTYPSATTFPLGMTYESTNLE